MHWTKKRTDSSRPSFHSQELEDKIGTPQKSGFQAGDRCAFIPFTVRNPFQLEKNRKTEQGLDKSTAMDMGVALSNQ